MTISIPDLKKTDEFKMWASAIRKDYPNMLESAIDMAIWAHKANPRAYQNEYNEIRAKKLAVPMQTPQPPGEIDCVCVYSGADDPRLPSTTPCIFAE